MAFADPLPTSTISVFCQPVAPYPGWVKITTFNDYTLRVVSTLGGGGGYAGSLGVSSVFSNYSVSVTYDGTVSASTNSVALTAPQLPSHSHGDVVSSNGSINPSGPTGTLHYLGGPRSTVTPPSATYATPGTGTAIPATSTGHSHGLTGPASTTANATLNFRVKYVDMIQAQRI